MATNAPFNIRKVNGQWVFTDGVFGSLSGQIAKELKIVPEDMIPDTVYTGGKTAYIPETAITQYFTGKRFSDAVAAVDRVRPGGTLAAGRGIDAATAFRSISGAVSTTLSKVDVADHTARAAAATKKITDAAAEAAKASGTMYQKQVTGDPAWMRATSILGSYTLSPDGMLVDKTNVPMLLLPKFGATTKPRKGAVGHPGLQAPEAGPSMWQLGAGGDSVLQIGQEFFSSLSAMKTDAVKKWQKALGVPTNGILSLDLQKAIYGFAQEASRYNWNHLASGETKDYKPLDAFSFVMQAKKSGALGGGGSKTYTSSSVTKFSEANAGTVITDMFQNLVGRDPSAAETKQWMQKLNAAAQAAPQKSTLTRTGTNTSTVSTPGFGEAEAKAMVRNQLAMSPESQSLMASTNLYDAFMQAIQNPMG